MISTTRCRQSLKTHPDGQGLTPLEIKFLNSLSILEYRKCLISAKIGSEPRITGSVHTNDNFFLR